MGSLVSGWTGLPASQANGEKRLHSAGEAPGNRRGCERSRWPYAPALTAG
jgi:hypothetical protein